MSTKMIGGDVYTRDHRYSHKALKIHQSFFFGFASPNKISIISVIIILINAEIGADPFYIVGGFSCGIIETILIGLITLFFTIFSFYILMRSWGDGSYFTYRLMWKTAFDSCNFVPSLMLFITYMTITILLTQEMCNTFVDLLCSGGTKFEPPAIVINKWFVVYLVSFLTVLPILPFCRVSSFHILSWISVFGTIVGVICVIIQFFKKNDLIGFDPNNQLVLFKNDWKRIFHCFGLFNTAMFIHPIVSYVVIEMEKPTVGRTLKAFCISSVSSFFLNIICGLFGYFTFYDSYVGNSILTYFAANDAVVIVGKVGYFISVIFTNSLYVYMAMIELSSFLINDILWNSNISTAKQNVTKISAGVVIILMNIALFDLVPNVESIYEIIGNICILVLAFGIPPICYLKIFGLKASFHGIGSVVLIIITVVVLFCLLYFYIV